MHYTCANGRCCLFVASLNLPWCLCWCWWYCWYWCVVSFGDVIPVLIGLFYEKKGVSHLVITNKWGRISPPHGVMIIHDTTHNNL